MLQKLKSYRMAPYVSGCLVAVNVVVFLVCTFDGGLLYNIGGLSPYALWQKKEYYRILASMFLHADIQHLVNNMLLLFGLGAMIEKEIGHVAFAVLYFVCGIGGNVVSLGYKVLEDQWYVVSIGASGAVLGLVGVLLVIAVISRAKFPNVTPGRILFVVAYSIYCGLGNSTIDNAAHIGGVVTGILAGGVWHLLYTCRNCRRYRSDSNREVYRED